jgi:hypothetical protein
MSPDPDVRNLGGMPERRDTMGLDTSSGVVLHLYESDHIVPVR